MQSQGSTTKSGGLSKNVLNETEGYSDRVSRLTDKLNGLQLNIKDGQSRKQDDMDSKLKTVDTKIVNWHEDNNKKFNNIKDQLGSIFKYIDEDKTQKEHQLEQRLQDVRGLETRLIDRFDQEVAARRESERRMFALVEERTASLRNEIAKESKHRFDSIEFLKQTLERDFPRLQEALNAMKAETLDGDNLITKRIEEEGARLTEILDG